MAKEGKPRRCAIYTRKSTEEGLDKAFNSLDAQREACAAYVLSQQHEGWTLAPDIYDDGGYSGGNLERPGLQQLLADVRAGRIDVVVVYKIDRLTRSLSDFAKIVDVLDLANASFVSVTQAFSTTTSMGRLTLNVLLSFAQFEREVIAERIRDKVAASKAKGMWMGGPVPLGYEVKERRLVIVPSEAATVTDIMQRYLNTTSVRTLVEELREAGIVTKVRRLRNGTTQGGTPMRRGGLYWLLSNRVYVGETVHKGKAYPGQHEAIVSRELFDAVQAKLAGNASVERQTKMRRAVSLLAGMIRDAHGRRMSPYHTTNHGRRYCYYASNLNDGSTERALRLPAGELDRSIRNAVARYLREGEHVTALGAGLDASSLARLFDCSGGLVAAVTNGTMGEVRELLRKLHLEVSVRPDGADATMSAEALFRLADIEGGSAASIVLDVPTLQASYGHEPRLRLAPKSDEAGARDERLVELIARAVAARDELLVMNEDALGSLPINKLRHLQRLARLAYLEPGIVRSVLAGTQPTNLSARSLWRMSELPLNWCEQRAALSLPAH